jgi:hypothetical protein
MSIWTFLIANGARIAFTGIKEGFDSHRERQPLLVKQRTDRLAEAWEPTTVYFLDAADDVLVEEIFQTLPLHLLGSGVPLPCSYCATGLETALTNPPEVRWTRLYKQPPVGARDLRILIREGWSLHGAWQVGFAPCSQCGLQHQPVAGEFADLM